VADQPNTGGDSDDRFGDLGAERRPSAAERLAAGDAAELAAERRQQREKEGPPRPSSAYSWVIGIAFLIAVAVAGANALRSGGPGALGPRAGHQLPVFAAPLATGPLDGDANVKTKASQPGKTFACDVRMPGALNVCQLRRKPVVLTFMFTRFANCAPQLDRIERVRPEFPGVNFVGVIIREPKDKAAALVHRHNWRFPVLLDRDGEVSNIYGIGGCPTTVFAAKGGRVRATRLGELSVAQLRAQTARIAS
jgi:peroxiredoxin